MTQITCQHSGLVFEATSKRTQQHPDIAARKKYWHRDGLYREGLEALGTVRNKGGYTTIEEYLAKVEALVQSAEAKRDAEAKRERELKEAKEARKLERKAQNAFLKRHGYLWRKTITSTEEDQFGSGYYAGIGEADGYKFELVAPDGVVVNVEQALDEIELGIIKARAWTAAIEENKVREAQRTENAEAAEMEALHAAIKEAQQHAQVEKFDFSGFETVAAWKSYSDRAWVHKGTIEGVECWVVEEVGDMDITRYYCADAGAAGLTPIPPADAGERFNDIFG